MELVAAISSPIITLLILAIGAVAARKYSSKQPSISGLVVTSLIYAGACLVLSLIGTIFWMSYYENTTGYSAGNAPLGWIFFYAPLSITLGMLIAFIHWLYSDAI